MNLQNSKTPGPTQLFEQKKNDLIKIFENKSAKLPQNISKYQIVEELGRGGMGIVYKTFAPQLDTFVALKVILINKTSDDKTVQRFIREARALAKLNHLNIVKIYDIGIENHFPYFTMQYIEGPSLWAFLKNTPLNIRLFSKIMVKIGQAMAYAHKQGIIHRDLKPGNILIGKDGEPYVMDFGLAKLTKAGESLTKTGTVMGTPCYMSPEQARSEKIDQRTDVYALGAIFYEMLAGKKLVEGENPTNIIYKVIHEEPALLRTANANLAKDLESICTKAVAKNIQKRYQSVEEFTKDIERFLNGKLVKARPVSIWDKLLRKVQNNRDAVWACVISVLLAMIAIWFFENRSYAQIHLSLAKTEKWQQQAVAVKAIDKKLEIYIKTSNLLEKTLVAFPHNFAIKSKLVTTLEEMALLAIEQKNYLLSFALLRQCKRLGYKKADKLLNKLEQEKDQLEKKHRQFIVKAMKKIAQNKKIFMERYIFAIAKMQNPYVVEILVPYLKSNNKLQRLLAIRALGKLGNNYTKFQNKDSVEWLMEILRKFKNKRKIAQNRKETEKIVEEVILALGWLADSRANKLLYDVRSQAGEGSLLWNKTVIAYKRIPLADTIELNNARQFVTRGTMNATKGNHLAAVADYNKAIELNPKYYLSYNSRGAVYRTLKHHLKAIADFNQAIRLKPNYLISYTNRALTYLDLKEYTKAIVDCTQAIKINPKYAKAYNDRSLVYFQQKEYRKAVTDCTQAIKINPKYAKAYCNRAMNYLYLKKYKKAIADCTQALILEPQLLLAYVRRGAAYFKLKNYPQTIADYTQAIKIYPKSSQSYSNRALAFNRLGLPLKAIVDYTTAIKFDPKFLDAYANRSSVYFNIKEYEKSMFDCNQAIKLNPKYAEIYQRRATIYAIFKNYPQAIADHTLAIKYKHKSTYIYRAHLYYQTGKIDKAIDDYRQTIKADFNNLAEVNPYAYLLLMGLKRKKGQEEQIAILNRYAKKQSKSKFGWSLVKYYIGIYSEKMLFAIANQNPKQKRGRLCEFFYYMGLNSLAKGNKNKARKCFENCLKYEIKSFIEPRLAKVELKMLANK